MHNSRPTFSRPFFGITLTVGLLLGALQLPLTPSSAIASEVIEAVAMESDGHSATETEAAQEALSSGEPVTVDSLTTPTEVTVANPDGTLTSEVSTVPVRMKTPTSWETISTDLVPATVDGEEVLVPEMAPIAVSLGTEGTSMMATLDDKQGHSVVQSWPFGDLPEPAIDGDTATYPSVLPGVDLIQVVRQTGVSQVLKIYTAEAAQDPRVAKMRFFLDTRNAEIKDNTAGTGISAVDETTGKLALHTAEGQWWDSSWEGASAKDPGGPGLTYPFSLSVGLENDEQTQVFGMSEILKAPNLTYPLYVDPNWSTSRTAYLYVDSAWPTTSYWNGQYTDSSVHVGYLPPHWDYTYGVSHVTRGFYQFNTSALPTRVIKKAVMNVTEVWSPSCTARPVSVWYTGNVGTGTTWNAQPAWSQKLSTQNVAYGNSASCPQAQVGFDMTTARGSLGTDTTWTVGLRADNEGDELGWKRFSNAATITLDYDRAPNTPTIWGLTTGRWTGTPGASTYLIRVSNPQYDIKVSDPDGDSMSAQLAIYNSAGTKVDGTVTNVTAASDAHVRWSGKAIPDGAYTLKAQSKDSWGMLSPWMSFNFTIDTKPPVSPDVTAVSPELTTGTDPEGVIGQTPYTFKLYNPGPEPVTGFIYAVTGDNLVPSVPSNMTCNGRASYYTMVCPADGKTSTIQAAAISKQNTRITVWSIDQAGNVGEYKKSTGYDTAAFSVGKESPMPDPANALPVTLSGNAVSAGVMGDLNGPAATDDCSQTIDPDPGNPFIATVLNLTGGYATTGTAAADTAATFTASGWFCPTAVPTDTTKTDRPVITQVGPTGTVLMSLRIGGASKKWELNLPTPTGADYVMTGAPVTINSWYFVNAVYDKINHQLRITSSTDASVSTWVVATSTDQHLAVTTGSKVLLGAASTLATAPRFTGLLAKPALTPGVLTADQITQLWGAEGADVKVAK
jgi:hypothetical protein